MTERFSNPFIKHYLLSISLNSVSKYKARILGTVLDYQRKQGRLPPRLTFALAALIAFYRGREIRDGALIGRRDGADYRIQDDAAVLEAFRDAWQAAGDQPSTDDACLALVRRVLARADFWGQDLTATLPGFDAAVARDLRRHLHRRRPRRARTRRLTDGAGRLTLTLSPLRGARGSDDQ